MYLVSSWVEKYISAQINGQIPQTAICMATKRTYVSKWSQSLQREADVSVIGGNCIFSLKKTKKQEEGKHRENKTFKFNQN